MTGDVHTPTNAGPDPVEPNPGEPAAGWTAYAPEDEDPHPELIVGAAFVGGVIAAFLLKRFSSNDD